MSYLNIAERLGIDLDALKRGEVITKFHRVNSISEYREIFAEDVCDDLRSRYAESCPEHSSLAPEMATALEYVYGERALTNDLEALSRAVFPITVQITVGATVIIGENTPAVGPNALSYALIAGDLIFDGGSLVIKSTVSRIYADNLIIKNHPGRSAPHSYHIGILGNPGAAGNAGSAGEAYALAAASGQNNQPTSAGVCNPGGKGGTGNPGGLGRQGGDGHPGEDGQSSLNATITIKQFDKGNESDFVVYTISGAGGPGGAGGAGGVGQNGGEGGKGCNSGCEGNDGGDGGKGGAGGNGGNGGVGGSGVGGQPIAISFPDSAKDRLVCLHADAQPGAGGAVGLGGAGGKGGKGGTGGKHSQNGVTATDGVDGASGNAGAAGKGTGAPGRFNIKYTTK